MRVCVDICAPTGRMSNYTTRAQMLATHINIYVNVSMHENVAVKVFSKISLNTACTSAYPNTHTHSHN